MHKILWTEQEKVLMRNKFICSGFYIHVQVEFSPALVPAKAISCSNTDSRTGLIEDVSAAALNLPPVSSI